MIPKTWHGALLPGGAWASPLVSHFLLDMVWWNRNRQAGRAYVLEVMWPSCSSQNALQEKGTSISPKHVYLGEDRTFPSLVASVTGLPITSINVTCWASSVTMVLAFLGSGHSVAQNSSHILTVPLIYSSPNWLSLSLYAFLCVCAPSCVSNHVSFKQAQPARRDIPNLWRQHLTSCLTTNKLTMWVKFCYWWHLTMSRLLFAHHQQVTLAFVWYVMSPNDTRYSVAVWHQTVALLPPPTDRASFMACLLLCF